MISVLSETQERFFLAIGKQIPLERLIELHLFQPMRQGGVESGVAVIAAVPEGEVLPGEPAAAEEPEPLPGASPEGDEDTAEVEAVAGALQDDDDLDDDEDSDDSDDTEDMRASDDDEDDLDADESMDANGHAAADDTERSLDGLEESDEGDVSRSEAEAPAEERPRRYTVYTAHYRHVLKGPDRGKWEASVVAEADAPLLTVDVVVRGVLRRSGDAAEVERLTGDEVRKALRQTTAPPAAPARSSR